MCRNTFDEFPEALFAWPNYDALGELAKKVTTKAKKTNYATYCGYRFRKPHYEVSLALLF